MRRLIVPQRKRNPSPSLPVQLQRELFAIIRKDGRLNYAPVKNQDFPRPRIDLRRSSLPLPGLIRNPRKPNRQQNAGNTQPVPWSRIPQPQKRKNRQERLCNAKPKQPPYENPRRKRHHRPNQRIAHVKLVARTAKSSPWMADFSRASTRGVAHFKR